VQRVSSSQRIGARTTQFDEQAQPLALARVERSAEVSIATYQSASAT
jgi:hypothetical protein